MATQKSTFRICIVGGGIAGIAAAIGLRGPGRHIIVLEQSKSNREIGAAISLQPNASRILAKWGLLGADQPQYGVLVDKGFQIYGTDGCLQKQKHMHEVSTGSWTSEGSLDKLLQTFDGYPEWMLSLFKAAPELGLWQLRDLEALSAFFASVEGRPDKDTVAELLKGLYDCRLERASLVQAYSRQQAKPATAAGSSQVTLNVSEFKDYILTYMGASAWTKSKGLVEPMA